MTLPAPPSSGFSSQENVGALIALKALRVDNNYPDRFNKNEGRPTTAVFLDVWVLADSREVGAFYSDTPNSSLLGKQFANNLGTVFYGRLVAEKRGAGTSVILGEPYPSDAAHIEAHKAALAAEQAPQANPNYRPPTYQNEPAWQQPTPPAYTAPAQPAVAAPSAAPVAPTPPAVPTPPPAYAPQVYPPAAPTPPAPPTLPNDPPF